MENLIVLAIIVLASAVHGWIKRRQGQGEAESETETQPGSGTPPARPANREVSQGRPSPPSRPQPATDWQEELRRLLQGERKEPAVPPVHHREPAQVSPPPIPPPTPRVSHSSTLLRGSGEQPGGAVLAVPVEVFPVSSPRPHHSAAEWQTSIDLRMKSVGARVTSHEPSQVGSHRPPESRIAVGFLQNRTALRAAFIASVILGPPKSLETT